MSIRETQKKAIIGYLTKNRGGITSHECIAKLGIMNLTTLLSTLGKEGYKFTKEREYGAESNWNRYYLLETPKVK